MADGESVFADESSSVFAADNRRDYSVSSSQAKRTSLLPLLLIAGACLVGVLWLASRNSSDTPQSVVLQPLPVTPSQESLPSPVPNAVVPPVAAPSAAVPLPTPEPVAIKEPVVQQQPPVETKPVAPPKIESHKAAIEPAAAQPVSKKKVVPVAAVKAMKSVNWKAKPDNYTVQLIAAYSEQGVERIKARLPATPPSAIHKTSKDGKPWFILVYGSFATKQEAQNAQSRLPSALQKDVKPWVRKQGEVFAQ